MHTVVKLSTGDFKVMLVDSQGTWTNIMFGLDATQAASMANFLNGGVKPVAAFLKGVENNYSVTEANMPDGVVDGSEQAEEAQEQEPEVVTKKEKKDKKKKKNKE